MKICLKYSDSVNITSIKDRLIGKISSIKDESFLNELEEFLTNLTSQNESYSFSKEMKTFINNSESDIESGQILTHEEAIQHLKKCIEKQ